MKILANDGIAKSGIDAMESSGFKVITDKVDQSQLIDYINKNDITALLVRSATKVRKDIIDACPNLKLIGRGGVGMDNIDVDYARNKGLHVINTPGASSASVAELVFAHLFGMVRFLFDANRNMPLEGDTRFKELKKSYGAGIELRKKKIGIIGFGRIGREVAKIALGQGMEVIAHDTHCKNAKIEIDFYDGQQVKFNITSVAIEEVYKNADFITVHVPFQGKPLISKKEIEMMKDNVGLVNAARGGVINEVDLLDALESGKIRYAGLDVFENEPTPNLKVLMAHQISLSPHIGAATLEAQDRIGTELADQIEQLLK
ncbi:MAG: D-2-hydroxyacid dehydrogenase [Flavobacteriales bacterium]|nr:D-2-hydroxyacid dehydrogenase [Flavobacteriales bacterium]